MQSKMIITVSLNPSRHIAQVLTGLIHYAISHDIEIIPKQNKSVFEEDFIVTVEYDGNKIIYDCADGYMNSCFLEKILMDCDYYFKRSFSKAANAQLKCGEKIYPLGFNYYVVDPIIKHYFPALMAVWNVIDGKDRIKQLLKYSIKGETDLAENWVFENKKTYDEKHLPVVMFYTRIWSTMHPDEKDSFVLDIDRERVEIIRNLKKNSRRGRQPVGGGICSLVA